MNSLLENRIVQMALFMTGGALLLWAVLQRVRSWTDTALAQPLADLYVRATSGGAARPLGAVVLPDGRRVKLADLSVRFDALNRAVFAFEGRTYQVTQRRADGDYDSIRLSM